MTAVAGTGTLLRMALRRDRELLPATIATFVIVAGFSARATVDLYPMEASRAGAAGLVNATPALVALYGRIYDPTSLGAVAMFKLIGVGSVLVAVFTLLLVVRHTRADEESGRTELAGSGVVGRHAPLAAALLLATGACLALGALTAAVLAVSGLPVAGAAAFGASWAGAGLVFAGVAAVCAQLSTSARTARGLASAALVVAYVVRAAGDTSAPGARWISWLSPIGWAQQVRPFAGDRWYVVPVLLAGALALAAGAAALQASRDLGSGVLADRTGRARARGLSTPLALAWRLDRAASLAWTVGFALLGLVLGSIAGNVGSVLTTPQARRLMVQLGGVPRLTDAFLSAELGFVALFLTVFGISTVLRLHTEEATGRAEAVLATSVGRVRFAASHLLVAVAGTVVLTVAVGATTGIAHAASVGDAAVLGRDLLAALARLPAVWVLVALTVALSGLAGRRGTVAWAALVGCVVVGEFGPLIGLPGWVQHLSPYTRVPQLPGGFVDPAAVVTLVLVAVLLGVAGLAGFRRRDLVAD